MTTPAHCTRTWRTAGNCPANDDGTHHCAADDTFHHVFHVCDCGNPESPADVQAAYSVGGSKMVASADTPERSPAQTGHDPRLDVVEHVLDEVAQGNVAWHSQSHAILNALDAMRPDEDGEPDVGPGPGDLPAPAGLTPAQEIRLRVLESYGPSPALDRSADAAWVEHGDDGTPDVELRVKFDMAERAWKNVSVQRDEALARADLAEARLGHIADALRDFDTGTIASADFYDAAWAALAWTPDDTATGGTR